MNLLPFESMNVPNPSFFPLKFQEPLYIELSFLNNNAGLEKHLL